jgi:Spy/CpxP family protein refolding chaperone
MKSNSGIKQIIGPLATLLASACLATAQPTPDGPQHPPPPGSDVSGQPGRRPGPPGEGDLGPAFNRLSSILHDDQKASLRKILEAQRPRTQEMTEQLRAARQEVFLAGLAPKFDENEVRRRAMAAARIEAELMVMRAKSLADIRPPLLPEQLDKLRNAPPPGSEEGPGSVPRRPDGIQRDENGLPVRPPPSGPPPPK